MKTSQLVAALLALAALVITGSAEARVVKKMTNDFGATMTLSDDMCPGNNILQAAKVEMQEQKLEGCWFKGADDKIIVVMWEDGDNRVYYAKDFEDVQ